MRICLIILFISIVVESFGQNVSTSRNPLNFTGDFRFRVEHDWHSINSIGLNVDERSRLRYRFRFGMNYQLGLHSSFGARVRSGNLNDQQGPHITLGGGQGEFELVKVGFEKLFYKYSNNAFNAWVGKNNIPFKTINELFWNDNVYPEGVGVNQRFIPNSGGFLDSLFINLGHFVIRSENSTFNRDSYLQLVQFDFNLLGGRLNVFPGYFYFQQVGNLPDGKENFNLDYNILHIGNKLTIAAKPIIWLGFEYYKNFANYKNISAISSELKDQQGGYVFSFNLGDISTPGGWQVQVYFAHLEKYAIVDYFAQNDWVRWDYSSIGAAGSRISNFKGIEFRIGYAFTKDFNLVLRTYWVEELVNIGTFKEEGNRIRLDMNIGF